jgi:hypothetical protein
MIRALVLSVVLASLMIPAAEAQNCRVDRTTRKCIFVPASQRTPPDFAVGDVFPIYDFSMLMDLDRYGLKPVDGAWRYYKSGTDIYRVSTDGYTVLEIIRNARRR